MIGRQRCSRETAPFTVGQALALDSAHDLPEHERPAHADAMDEAAGEAGEK